MSSSFARAGRPSTPKLSEMLVKFGAATAPFTARDVKKHQVPMSTGFGLSDETYDRDSRIYIHCPDQVTRRRLEWHIQGEGVTTVNTGYSPKGSTVDVGVTYFKGWHWDE